jgi:GLPGLI family protein
MRHLIFFLLLPAFSQAQLETFIPETIVSYNFKYKTYLNEETIGTYNMWLMIKGSQSCFFDKEMFDLDTSMVKMASSVKNIGDAMKLVGSFPKPRIRSVVQKNLKDNLIQFNQVVAMDYYYYEEEPIFNWAIQREKETVLGYEVQRATCSFRGRNYTAWFTLQLPINDGPYKFSGLPGLILKIYDDKKEVFYEANEIIKASPQYEIVFQSFRDPLKVSKKEFMAASQQALENPLAGIDSNPNIRMDEENRKKVMEMARKRAERKINPIEMED